MSRIFISHAGKDKKLLVEPLVRALLFSKQPLFVDDPGDERWSFTANEVAEFEREGLLDSIREGFPYDDELDRGLRECDVILLCLSGNISELRDIIVAEVNRAEGIHARRLELITYDDGYEPRKAIENTNRLIEHDAVFALIGEVGTPTSRAVAVTLKSRAPPSMAVSSVIRHSRTA